MLFSLFVCRSRIHRTAGGGAAVSHDPKFACPEDFSYRFVEPLLAQYDLPLGLGSLCEAMRGRGRKAEQEFWL